MKKIISLVLAVLLMLGVLCCTEISAATEEFKIDDGVLLSYTGDATDIIIPPGVYYIGDSVFEGNTKIRSVDLADTVIIGNKAFYGCTSLESVKGGDKVRSCGGYAMFNTPYLASFSGDIVIGTVLLGGKTSGAYTVPDKVRTIAPYAFSGNTAITSLKAAENVAEIGEGAFYNCSSLASVSVDTATSYIGAFAFEGTKWLSGNKDEFVRLGGGILIKYNGSLERVAIPEGTLHIAAGAFYNNKKITAVSFPSTLTSIGMRAFAGCSRLASADIKQGISFIDKEAFAECTALTEAVIPASVAIVGDSVYLGCSKIKTARYYSSSELPDGMFTNCTSLEKCIIASKTERLGDYAFYGCKSLRELCVPPTVKVVSDTVLGGVKNVTVYCDSGSFVSKQLGARGIKVSQMGDANLDGSVNVKDATYVQKAVAGLLAAEFSNTLRGDSDFSGELNVRDATRIQKIVAGLV